MKLKNTKKRPSYFKDNIIDLELVCLEDNSYHILCRMSIGGETGLMIVDTGASISVIDENFVKKMNYQVVQSRLQSRTINGSIEDIAVIKHQEVMIGNTCVGKMNFATLDLTPVNEMYEKQISKRVIGLLGSDFLQRYKAVIDYGCQKMVIKTQRF